MASSDELQYPSSVLPKIEELLGQNRRRPIFLFDEVDTLVVPTKALESVDPSLLTLLNVNSPDDYRKALQLAEFETSEQLLARLFGDDSPGGP